MVNKSSVGTIAKIKKQNTSLVFKREPSLPRRSSRMSFTPFLKTRKISSMMRTMFTFMSAKKKILLTKGSLWLTRKRCTSTMVEMSSVPARMATATRSLRLLLRSSVDKTCMCGGIVSHRPSKLQDEGGKSDYASNARWALKNFLARATIWPSVG